MKVCLSTFVYYTVYNTDEILTKRTDTFLICYALSREWRQDCFTPEFPCVHNQWRTRAGGDEIRIIDRTIAGVSHEAMAVIPTTVEFVHCELDAICSEDLLRCHTGSPLDQFVSQSRRYRRRHRSSSSSRALFESEKSTHEMRLIQHCFLLLDRSFLQGLGYSAFVVAPIGKLLSYSIETFSIGSSQLGRCMDMYLFDGWQNSLIHFYRKK